MRLWVLIICISGLCACTSQRNIGMAGHTSKTQEDENRYVIFKTKKISKSKEMKSAQLSKKEINQIRLLIKKAIEEYNSAVKSQGIQTLDRYKIQFVPFLNSKNEKEVWVNCFCDDLSELGIKWRKEILNVYDGGSCFFNLKINLTLNISYDLYVNGVA